MEKRCLNCHKKFIPTHKYLKVIQKFCSEKCRATQLVSSCFNCKKTFTWDKHGRKLRKYCSDACSRLGSRNRVFLRCRYCNKEFWVRASALKYKNVQHCSKKCLWSDKKGRQATLKKYNNKPEVKLKKQEYHFGGFYKDGLRNQVVKRDNYTCQLCNKEDSLIVHHIDGDRFNNVLKNLITLCKSCHPKVHSRWGLKDWRTL